MSTKLILKIYSTKQVEYIISLAKIRFKRMLLIAYIINTATPTPARKSRVSLIFYQPNNSHLKLCNDFNDPFCKMGSSTDHF